MHANRGKLYEWMGQPVILTSVWKKPKKGGDCTIHVLASKGHLGRIANSSEITTIRELKRIKRSDLPLYIHLEFKSDKFLKLLRGG